MPYSNHSMCSLLPSRWSSLTEDGLSRYICPISWLVSDRRIFTDSQRFKLLYCVAPWFSSRLWNNSFIYHTLPKTWNRLPKKKQFLVLDDINFLPVFWEFTFLNLNENWTDLLKEKLNYEICWKYNIMFIECWLCFCVCALSIPRSLRIFVRCELYYHR